MKYVLASTLVLLPSFGHALSCMRPNPAIEMNRHFKNDRNPIVLLGKIVPIGPPSGSFGN